ncbi:hypothetical protein CKA32_004653 [Geitlerinema sp. FC II]|nr:hypothetical protein CKA32_004653 [Geitlerinema sp. FC II]
MATVVSTQAHTVLKKTKKRRARTLGSRSSDRPRVVTRRSRPASLEVS